MGIWEDEWMQYISDLDQEEANLTLLRSVYYYRNLNQSALSNPLPSDVYPYSSKLTVHNLYTGQQAVLLCTSSTSCQLLTTLYLYSTQFCFFILSLLFIGYIALVILCLLACRHSYDYCFAGDQKKSGKNLNKAKGYLNAEEKLCPHCNCQRDIIIQVNRGSQPLQSQFATRQINPFQAHDGGNLADAPEMTFNKNAETVVDAKDVENAENLVMHFDTHQQSVDLNLGDDMKTETSSMSSDYLSDLLSPPSFTSSSILSTSSISKSLKKKHSILYFPFSKHHQSTFHQLPEPEGDKVDHKNDFQDLEFVETEQLEFQEQQNSCLSNIPMPSYQVPSFMMLNRFVHKISEVKKDGKLNEDMSGDTLV